MINMDIDLDFVVLALNKMNKDTEFTRQTVKFIDRERLFQFISLILDGEEEYIQSNRDGYMTTTFY